MKNDPKMQIFFDEANRLLESNHTFKNIFDVHMNLWPKRTAFIYEDENNKCHKVTYREYAHKAKQYGHALSKLIKDPKESFIAIKMKNSPKWTYVFWGLLVAGYNPILINPILLDEDVEYLLNEANVKTIISDKDEKIATTCINVNNIELSEKLDSKDFGSKVAFCTSGTTGKSRIFVYNAENIIHQIYAAYCIPDTSDTVLYQKPDVKLITIVPFAHIFGFTAVFLWFTFFGRTLVFTKSIAPEEIVKMCKKYRVSHIFAVPLFFDRVAKSFNDEISKQSSKKQDIVKRFVAYNNKEISKTEAGLAASKLVRNKIQKQVLGNGVVHCIAGGSALSKDTLRTINGIGYPLYNGYGMTEIGVTSTELSPNVVIRNKGSVGKPLTGIEYKIDNNELLVKSEQIHSETLVNGKLLPADIDENGYFHTGDIAEIDQDGNTYIKGKLKDVIISPNGENIYPDEIENKFKDIPGIDEISALGLSENGKEKMILAIHVPNKLTKEEIKDMESRFSEANSRLPISMQVQEFYLSINPLPTNASMKVMRYKLVDEIKNNPTAFVKLGRGSLASFEEFKEADVKEISSHIRDIVGDILNVDKNKIADLDHFIIDLGGDSFTYMSIIASIESELKIKIPTEMIGKLNTVNEFTLFVLKNRN